MARLLVAQALAALLLTACGGYGGSPSGAPASSAGAGSQSRSATRGNASLQLSGAISGSFVPQGVVCQPPGFTDLLVSISGMLESAQYTIDISAGAGTHQLTTAGTATVGITETNPGFSRWAAGYQQVGASGSLTIEERRGQVDAELAGVQGAPGTVHIVGNWTCP